MKPKFQTNDMNVLLQVQSTCFIIFLKFTFFISNVFSFNNYIGAIITE